jgi:hypothetical protein
MAKEKNRTLGEAEEGNLHIEAGRPNILCELPVLPQTSASSVEPLDQPAGSFTSFPRSPWERTFAKLLLRVDGSRVQTLTR